MKARQPNPTKAFTLIEGLIAMACASFILAAVITASTALQRSFMATEAYSIAERDQLRVSDYISMDCRRAISASVAANALTLTLPQYYDYSGNAITPSFDANGAIQYGTGTVRVRYYASGTNFLREVTSPGVTASTTTTVIASNVDAFTVSSQDLTSSVTCSITFAPRFKSFTSPGSVDGTIVFSSTFLRNAAARQ